MHGELGTLLSLLPTAGIATGALLYLFVLLPSSRFSLKSGKSMGADYYFIAYLLFATISIYLSNVASKTGNSDSSWIVSLGWIALFTTWVSVYSGVQFVRSFCQDPSGSQVVDRYISLFIRVVLCLPLTLLILPLVDIWVSSSIVVLLGLAVVYVVSLSVGLAVRDRFPKATLKAYLALWAVPFISLILASYYCYLSIERPIQGMLLIANVTLLLQLVIYGFIVGLRITELHEDKAQLQELLLEAIQHSNMTLKNSDRMKDEFLATISHELRTPMNGVIGSLELLDAATVEDQEVSNTLHVAEESARHMMSLIEDILCLSESRNNRLVIRNEHFRLAEELDALLQFYRRLAEAKGLEFRVEFESLDSQWLYGDSRRLVKILQHVLDNAVKFTQQGYVKLTVKKVFDALIAPDQTSKIALLFSVEDSGIGVPEAIRRKIYDAFELLDSSMKREYGGLGIGLSICRDLTKAMEGCISFSNKSPGVVFDIILMFEAREPSVIGIKGDQIEGMPASAVLSHQAEPKRILVIDDNVINQQIMYKMLTKKGYQVVVAENGEQGVMTYFLGKFDLILMDCQMPVMDGFEATRKIREHDSTHVPIIAVTANASSSDQQRCIDIGMDDFIRKPVRQKILYAKVEKYLFAHNSSVEVS